MSQNQRPEFFALQNGCQSKTAFFRHAEYENRLGGLRRELMASSSGVDAMLLTSMHNIAYYSGFPVLFIWPPLCLRGNRRPLCHGLRQHRSRPALAALVTATT